MIPVLAQMMDRDDMRGGGHWWVWLIGVAVLIALITLVVVLVVRLGAPGPSAAASAPQPSRPSAEEVLADRLARGEIDEDEYRRRRDALRA